jgi:16S rRNA G966 N2-methylase RsmD
MPSEPQVTAVELDPDTFECLRSNMLRANEIVGKPVTCPVVNADCTKYLAGELTKEIPRADFVFFDPPWGGADFKKKRSMELALGECKLHNVVGDALDRENAPTIIVKLPYNANVAAFTTDVARERSVVVTSHDVYKPNRHLAYRLLFVRKGPKLEDVFSKMSMVP